VSAQAEAERERSDPRGPVRQDQSLADALGGVRGVAETSVPAAAYVVALLVTGRDTTASAIVAAAVGVLLFVVRIVQRDTLQYALSGLVGVGLAAFVAARTGRAEDFFLVSILKNVGFALAYLVSILVRWPLLGVLVGAIRQQPGAWREDPAQLRAFSRASWIWVGMFVLRIVIQTPLWAAGLTVALGTANVALGLPLYLAVLWLTWLVLRDQPLVRGTKAL
jgi:hypothetical protein